MRKGLKIHGSSTRMNEWDQRILTGVKERPADCIRIDEVAAAFKKTKRQSTRLVMASVVLPIYKGKGDPMKYGSYRGIKLLEHAMKMMERIFKHKIRQQINI